MHTLNGSDLKIYAVLILTSYTISPQKQSVLLLTSVLKCNLRSPDTVLMQPYILICESQVMPLGKPHFYEYY